jgi:nicotinate dehydrogenase subunit A
MSQRFGLTVNGTAVEVVTDPDTPLLSVLRNQLDLKGSRFGCGMSLCGACFVLVDGTVVPSCDTPVWSVEGRVVTTVEGLGEDGRLHAVQQAILDQQAAQCGFCISGIAVSAAALLQREPAPDEEQVKEALDRNLCRCGVQRRIVEAVIHAGSMAARGDLA